MDTGEAGMNICVLGLGHSRCVISASLSKLGHMVVGLDFDKGIVRALQDGSASLSEPGVAEIFVDSIRTERLLLTSDPQMALRAADAVWVALDIPVDDRDIADVDAVKGCVVRIMPFLKDGGGIIISSQVHVGFVGRMERTLLRSHPDKRCHFAYCPENLQLGKALNAFLDPDRIVIGIRNEESKEAFLPLFSSISARLEWMQTKSAEMAKNTINSFLAISVCFANEIASICERVGADAREVERGLRTEKRIGPKAFLRPGAAFSGGTLARDINYLTRLSGTHRLPSYLIQAVNKSNNFHKKWVIRKCREVLPSLKNRTVAILALAYKPGIDSLRRSYAIELARFFHERGTAVQGFDPGSRIPNDVSALLRLKSTVQETIVDADVVIIVTELPQFLEFGDDIVSSLRSKFVIDPNGAVAKLVDSASAKYFAVRRKS